MVMLWPHLGHIIWHEGETTKATLTNVGTYKLTRQINGVICTFHAIVIYLLNSSWVYNLVHIPRRSLSCIFPLACITSRKLRAA